MERLRFSRRIVFQQAYAHENDSVNLQKFLLLFLRLVAFLILGFSHAVHAEPIAACFGQVHRASADGHSFYLDGPGEAGGAVNGLYGFDPVVKIYTLIADR